MKKTKLIALTMVVALMMVGAGYAAWSDTLNITQEVNTGYLDVHFVGLGGEEVNIIKGVGNTTAKVEYSKDNSDEAGQNIRDNARITIDNAYPTSSYEVELQMKNDSTMPVELTGLVKGMSEGANDILGASDFTDMKVNINNSKWHTFTADQLKADGFNYPIPKDATIGIKFTFTTPEVGEDTTYRLWVEPTFEIFQ